jgi:pentapeptide MXKDX repeat protein
MKKVASSIVAVLVSMSFAGFAFSADTMMKDEMKPAAEETKTMKKDEMAPMAKKKVKKAKKIKKEMKKESMKKDEMK